MHCNGIIAMFLKSPYLLEIHTQVFTDEMVWWSCFKPGGGLGGVSN